MSFYLALTFQFHQKCLSDNKFGDRYAKHYTCRFSAINESYFKGFNNVASPINYSAQTTKLNAQTDVLIGKKYPVKLVIADDKAQYFDSAVFLERGSFYANIDRRANYS